MPDTSANIDYERTASVARLHAAAARESGEPVANATPVSLWAVVGIAACAIIAGSYFGANGGTRLRIANLKGYNYEPQLPGVAAAASEMPDEELHLKENWVAAGKSVYAQCAACHTANGEGQPGLFPPLKGSEFVIQGERRLVAILQHGVAGSLTVNGKPFNGQMQPLGANMTDKQLAQLCSYIRNEWGNSASVIYEDQIKALRKELGNRASYTEDELRKIPADANAPPSEWPAKLQQAAPSPGAPAPAPPAK